MCNSILHNKAYTTIMLWNCVPNASLKCVDVLKYTSSQYCYFVYSKLVHYFLHRCQMNWHLFKYIGDITI